MDLFTILLTIHIFSGVICLIAGVMASTVKKRKGYHTKIGEIYHGAYVVIFITSIIMAIINWAESAYLFYIAVFSYGLCLFGYLARKNRWKNWISKHIGGMLGSFIGVVTATLVVNGSKLYWINTIPALLLWFLPTIIGTPIIIIVGRRYRKQRRVKKMIKSV